jgi:hypothetical protein
VSRGVHADLAERGAMFDPSAVFYMGPHAAAAAAMMPSGVPPVPISRSVPEGANVKRERERNVTVNGS